MRCVFVAYLIAASNVVAEPPPIAEDEKESPSRTPGSSNSISMPGAIDGSSSDGDPNKESFSIRMSSFGSSSGAEFGTSSATLVHGESIDKNGVFDYAKYGAGIGAATGLALASKQWNKYQPTPSLDTDGESESVPNPRARLVAGKVENENGEVLGWMDFDREIISVQDYVVPRTKEKEKIAPVEALSKEQLNARSAMLNRQEEILVEGMERLQKVGAKLNRARTGKRASKAGIVPLDVESGATRSTPSTKSKC